VVAPIWVEEVVVANLEVLDVVDDVDVVLVLLVVVVVTAQLMSVVHVPAWEQHARYSPESGWPLSVHLSMRNRQFALRQNWLQIVRAWKSTPQLLAQFR
jgi:biopolymer transport protein ExbD